jgi:hypothetical protein
MLSKEKLLSLRPKSKPVFIAEWGETVYVRPLTEMERCKFLDLASQFEKAAPGVRNRKVVHPVIQWAVVDEDGNPFFSDLDEVTKFAETQPSGIFLKLQAEIFDFSAFSSEAREVVEKNSQPVPSDSSSSV